MAFLADELFDAALNYLDGAIEYLYICDTEPTTYAQAQTTYTLGNKAAPATTGPGVGDVSGRKLTIDAITDGTVTDTDTATHWALTDNSESLLLAVGALTAPQAVTSGNVFTLTAFDIEFPEPA